MPLRLPDHGDGEGSDVDHDDHENDVDDDDDLDYRRVMMKMLIRKEILRSCVSFYIMVSMIKRQPPW